jgi:hypothetical protein
VERGGRGGWGEKKRKKKKEPPPPILIYSNEGSLKDLKQCNKMFLYFIPYY